MVRQHDGEYRCKQHDITLYTPVRLFCRQITPPVDDDAYQQWFDDTIDRDDLAPNTLYAWVQTTTIDADNTPQKHIDHDVIAPLTAYLTWPAGTFWRVMRDVRNHRREQYRQHGYQVKQKND
jgi:hypothetical protein